MVKATDEIVYEFLKSAEDFKVIMMAYEMAEYLSQLDVYQPLQAVKQLSAMLDNDKIYSSGNPGDNSIKRNEMMNGIEVMKKAINLSSVGYNINKKGIDHGDFAKTVSEIVSMGQLKNANFVVNGKSVEGREEDANVELARNFVSIITSDPAALRNAIDTARDAAQKIRAFIKIREKELSLKIKESLEQLAVKSEKAAERLMLKCDIKPVRDAGKEVNMRPSV